ncbi:UdgX family uracil-DNA binding protein [Microbacterium trichothecenolyticum]|uniref:UdgX family uracil-DNA binding protein n=1 Tax=Microbacterium trichothecenolyticum TaxID=69370 RepID=UPI001C6F109B|nr:UdgX family uracil-DNA binding protein [Microbacterium trichothecenolyticum]MBW9119100.1 UdgX family uracil-DNA binding protein [Microbacterium trichothecenolyticum]
MDVERPGAEKWVPSGADVHRLREAVQGCRGCELWRDATQAVFGDGEAPARMMLVGEQPGDKEDLAGEPFVGPAGRVLAQALDEAGIARDGIYLTNAVKHFRFEQRGKRRIHQRPDAGNIAACRPWLEAEFAAVDPAVVVCLGATAARAVLGRVVKIGAERGTPLESEGRTVVVTIHPSAVLRLRDSSERGAAIAGLVADLRLAAESLRGAGAV